jgi:hypothetical protein
MTVAVNQDATWVSAGLLTLAYLPLAQWTTCPGDDLPIIGDVTLLDVTETHLRASLKLNHGAAGQLMGQRPYKLGLVANATLGPTGVVTRLSVDGITLTFTDENIDADVWRAVNTSQNSFWRAQ